jgi:hypothetical protein
MTQPSRGSLDDYAVYLLLQGGGAPAAYLSLGVMNVCSGILEFFHNDQETMSVDHLWACAAMLWAGPGRRRPPDCQRWAF